MLQRRLRSSNAGAALHLLEDDLAIADWLPPSRGVHLIRAIVTVDGAWELAEYLIRPRRQQQFRHSARRLPLSVLAQLEQQLQTLGATESALKHYHRDDDPSAFEPPDRRCLRYWHGAARMVSALPIPRYFEHYGVPGDLARDYTRVFDAAWTLLIPNTSHGPGPVWASDTVDA